MAFCTNCGAELPAGCKFCTSCGEKVQSNPTCGSSTDPAARATTNPTPCDPAQPSAAQQTSTPPRINTGTPGFTFQRHETPRAPRKRTKTWLIVLLCVAAAALGAFGLVKVFRGLSSNAGGNDDILGRYEGISCTMDGVDLGIDDEWLELKSGKIIQINLLGDSYTGQWSLDGETLTITQQGDDYIGTLRDGVITIDFIGMTYVFAKDGAALPDSVAASDASATKSAALPTETARTDTGTDDSAVDASWWSGDWYGWWVMSNCTGTWASYENYFWDACATIEGFSDGTGYINIWDSDNEPGMCFAQANVAFVDLEFSQPAMVNVDGLFFDSDLEELDWFVSPDEHPLGEQIDNIIQISGSYTDEEGDGFDYTIFLRPWGTEWEDVRNADTSDMMFDDMMPEYYDSWYLPLIQSGKPMPEEIGSTESANEAD